MPQENLSVENFTESKLPAIGSKEWYNLNNSDDAIQIKKIENEILFFKYVEKNTVELHLPTGKLIGVDKGEWGGELTFTPSNGSRDKIKLKTGNIKFIFEFNGLFYFLEGLAHMSVNTGSVFHLNVSNNSFSVDKIMDLPGCPEALGIHGASLVIATDSYLFSLNTLFNMQIILSNAPWQGLYPNSIVLGDNERLYIGMRGGFIKFDLLTKRLTFFRYAKKDRR